MKSLPEAMFIFFSRFPLKKPREWPKTVLLSFIKTWEKLSSIKFNNIFFTAIFNHCYRYYCSVEFSEERFFSHNITFRGNSPFFSSFILRDDLIEMQNNVSFCPFITNETVLFSTHLPAEYGSLEWTANIHIKIFLPRTKIIENLLEHFYKKSIIDVLLLSSNFSSNKKSRYRLHFPRVQIRRMRRANNRWEQSPLGKTRDCYEKLSKIDQKYGYYSTVDSFHIYYCTICYFYRQNIL